MTKQKYYEKLGATVRTLREAKRITQQELAILLGLKSYQAIALYESGKVAMPTYYLHILSLEFGVGLEEILPKMKLK